MPPDSFEISLGSAGTRVVSVERSRRLRRMSLRVLPGGRIVVFIPEKMRGNALETARNFAEANAVWLKRTLEKSLKQKAPAEETLAEYLRAHPQLSACGKSYCVEFGEASVEPFFVFRKESPLAVICLRVASEEADLAFCLRKFAAKVLPEYARELAKRCGVSVGKITVRAQRSRWGSCTAGGDLSLNWRLVLLPQELQTHVILHELAHRRHMNHSGEFWDLLNAWDPETGKHDRALSREWNRLVSL